ncbi:caspase family protein [Candidatus Pelagibacter sp.]|nr:caspase family protein [Candidatus Pelagibacter sp.]
MMKRLLAYLFIVLGLGLSFNISDGNAESGYCINGLTSSFYRDKDGKKHFLKDKYRVIKVKNRKNHRDCHEEEFISKAKYKTQYKNIKKLVGPFKKDKSIPLNSILTLIKGTHVLVEYNRIYEAINNTLIAKAEPSQTQKVGKIDLNTDEIYNFTFDSKNKKKSTIYELISKKNNKIIIEAFEPTNYKEFTNNQINFEEIKQVAAGHCNSKIYNWDLKHKYGINLNGTFYPDRVKSITYTFKCPKINKTQIAKAELSQTQKVSTKDLDKANEVENYIKNIEKEISSLLLVIKKKKDKSKDCKDSRGHSDKCNLIGQVETSQIKNLVIQKKEYERIYKNIKTQITKVEPSQTQKVASKNTKVNTYEGIICVIKGNVITPYKRADGQLSSSKGSLLIDGGYATLNILKNENKSCANINNSENISYKEYLKVLKNPDLFLTQYGDLQNKIKNKICINNTTLKINNLNKNCASDESELIVAGGSKDVVFLDTVEKKIALKPKKKVKLAEKKPKQEEFKPKKTNQDNEAPVITIAEAITVNDTSYILEGRVTDKANKIFVEIDGQPVQVKKGKFKVKRYSPVDEQIKIVAIDQWGNKSKTKLVNITIDIDETIVANKLEPLNPSNISNKSSNNKVALIIGIENYTEAPKANYANLDAKYFFDYARRAFGVKKQNINLLVNEEATVVKTDKAVSLWLKSKIKKNKSDLIIFFAGHGLASSDGKELYLLPQDGNPDRLERTALSRTDLFKEIISLNPKSVTMFLDTCYSGVSRDEQMLLASARPIRIVADEQEGIPDNFTIFSASQLDQISSGLKEANHGIFSYYLMKGMEGNADINKDKKITNGELLAYMDENVSQKAAEQGREQNPSLAGDPDKVLMSYR